MAVSMAQAQSALLNTGFLDTLGQNRDDVGVSLSATDAAVIRAAARFVQDARDNLIKADRVSSGQLEKSIVPRVKQWENGVNIIQIMVADYYKFVDRGVKGLKGGNSLSGYQFRTANPSKKMVAAIEAWIRHEKLTFRNTKKAVSPREHKRQSVAQLSNSAAYMVARSIKRKGLKPSRFWTDAIEELEKDIATGVASALRIDVIESFK